MRRRLKIVAWNSKTGNPGAVHAVEWILMVHQPDVLILNEVQFAQAGLRKAAKDAGYQFLQETVAHAWWHVPVDERGDTAVLLAPWVEVKRDRVVEMKRDWIAPVHGSRHTPRRYRKLRIKVHGCTWRILAAHFPTGWTHNQNKAAVKETLRYAKRFLRRRVVAPSVVVGDLNIGTASLGAIFNTDVVGKGPDNAVVRGAHVARTVLEKNGSDHAAILYSLEKK